VLRPTNGAPGLVSRLVQATHRESAFRPMSAIVAHLPGVLAAPLIAGAFGALVVRQPKLATALAVLFAAGGSLVMSRGRSAPAVWAGVFLAVSALVNLPRLASFGPTTGLGLATIAAVVTGAWVLVWRPEVLGFVPRALLLYAGYLVVSLAFRPPSMAGAVSTFTGLAFIAALAIGAALGSCGDVGAWFRALRAASMVAITIGFVAVAIGSAVTANTNGDGIFSARPYAMFAVMGLAIGLASVESRISRLLILAALGFGVYSLSRSDLAAMAVMLTIGTRPSAGIVSWVVKAVVRLVIVFTIGMYVIQDYTPLHQRFYRGDLAQVAGVRLNVEGRTGLWSAVWHRFRTSPIVGHGAGDADVTAAAADPTAGHPHNDYLRVLDDTGIVGLVLWLLGYGKLVRRALWRGRDSTPEAYVARAAFQALLGIAVVMMFDNPMIYLFIVIPFGLLVGLGTAGERRDVAEWRAPGVSNAASR
jgi:O-Antigen ligase